MNISLERLDLFKPSLVRPNKTISKLLLVRGQDAAHASYQPNLSIIIRTKNDRPGLVAWLDYIDRQKMVYTGKIEVIVVDTESTDGTKELAKAAGAKLVKLKQSDFTYPLSINSGLKQADPESQLAFISVGHAYPALNVCFSAAVRHFKDPQVAGAYGTVLPNYNSTIWEDIMLRSSRRLKHEAKILSKPSYGIMGATNCMLRLSVWAQQPFDDAYAAGAEDGAWASAVIAKGYKIVFEPAMTVHHTHGLNFINTVREVGHWLRVYYGKPQSLNQAKLARRRPDLFR